MDNYDFLTKFMDKQAELDRNKDGKDTTEKEPEKEVTPEDYIKSKEKSGSESSSDKTEEADRLAEEAAKRNADEAAEKDDDTEIGITYEKSFRREVEHSDTKAQTARRPGRKSSSDAKSCQIRDFPLSLVKMCKLSLGEGDAEVLPNTKALAAFVYANRDPDLEIDYSDVSEDIIALSKHFDRTKTVNNINDMQKVIIRYLKELRLTLFENQALTMAVLLDSVNFINKETPKSVGDLSFTQDVLIDAIEKLEEDVPKLKQKLADREEHGKAVVKPKRGTNN